jgi:type IV pilus assembly protein PilP
MRSAPTAHRMTPLLTALALFVTAAPALGADDLVLTARGDLKDSAVASPAVMPAGHPAVPARPVKDPAAPASAVMPAGHPAVPAQPVAMSPAPAPPAQAAPDLAAMADAAAPTDTVEGPPAVEAEPYVYRARGLRDPFLPPAEVRAPEAEAKDVPPLERHALQSFRLVGVVQGRRGAYAMVTTAEGKGYTIRVGTRIGSDGGRVRRITKNSVIVEVVQPDEFGELKKSETILALRPEEVVP